MEKIKNQNDLIKKLRQDVKKCSQNKVFFLAGHFPLFYKKEKNIAVESIHYWGEFSTFTLELACEVAQYAKKCGKEIKFIFFVDDHAYEEIGSLHPKERSSRRDRLYKLRSGKKAKLPIEYKKIMTKYGFTENDVLRHDHNKDDRNDCLYFAEKILRASTKAIDNACAREYTEFLENPKYFNKKTSYLVAFIPNRCQGHICNVALGKEVKDINASHVFMETHIPSASREELFTMARGVTYRKD